MTIFDEFKKTAVGSNEKIVFPEGTDLRIIHAALRLQEEKLLVPILLGNREEIEEVDPRAKDLQIIEPEKEKNFEELTKSLAEIRSGKNTLEECREMMKSYNYYGTMMVKEGLANGMVSGAVHSTGDTVRPAFQIIGTKPESSIVSGAMLMLGPNDERFIFADVAINAELTEEQLAEVAVESCRTAILFGIDPTVAMLSFSTKGSAIHPSATKMANAAKLVKKEYPTVIIDGELQFDTAIDPVVAKQKSPDSIVQGNANVFIFPDLNAGNITYKVAERLGYFEAIGPILQGLDSPISDLSRGSSEDDIYKLSIITTLLAEKEEEY